MVLPLLTSLILVAVAQGPRVGTAPDSAHARAEERIETLLRRHPGLVRKHVLGTSNEGRELFVLRVSASEEVGTTEVYLGSGIHGNEGSEDDGLWMVEQLLAAAEEPLLARLLEQRVLWFQPMVNPDGIAAGERLNAAGVDLNRNFSYAWNEYAARGEYGHQGAAPFSEPETRLLRDFLRGREHLRAYLDVHCSASMIIVPQAGLGGRPLEACAQAARELGTCMGGKFAGAPTSLPRSAFSEQGGFSIDWVWFELGVMAFTWELPREPEPVELGRDPRWRGLLHVLEECVDYPTGRTHGAAAAPYRTRRF